MKKIDQNGNVKSKKPYSLWNQIGKKLVVGGLSLTLTIGAILGFAGCGSTTNITNNKPVPPAPENPPIVPPIEDQSITFDDFLANYNDEAVSFVENFIKASVIQDKEVLSKNYYISANEDDELDNVNLVYTYKANETNRIIELANVDLTSPVDLDDIVDGKASVSTATLNIERTEVFNFDAKHNYLKTDILNTLYEVADANDEAMKLFTEIESPITRARFFEIYTQSDEKITILELGAAVENKTDENIIENLKNEDAFYGCNTYESYKLKGVNILDQTYIQEKFEEPEPVKPDPVKPDPGPSDEITNEEVKQSLNESCALNIIQKCLVGLEINKNNITDDNWYLTTTEDNKITKAEYKLTYNRDEETSYIVIGSATFNTPISREDLKNGNLGKVTYKNEYVLNYNPTIQETRKDLTNAILTACGDELTEGSTRIIVDKGYDTSDSTLGESYRFQVVEVSNNEVKEYNVGIKYSNIYTDEEFIKNLQNNQFKNYSISGYSFKGDLLQDE